MNNKEINAKAEGYATAVPMIGADELGWCDEEGKPTLYDSKQEAQNEADADWIETLELHPDEHEDNKDYVVYVKEVDEDTYRVFDVDSRSLLFVHDRKERVGQTKGSLQTFKDQANVVHEEMKKLSKLWQHGKIDDFQNAYPFNDSFDEVVANVGEWISEF